MTRDRRKAAAALEEAIALAEAERVADRTRGELAAILRQIQTPSYPAKTPAARIERALSHIRHAVIAEHLHAAARALR
jgi:hypothetical protein